MRPPSEQAKSRQKKSVFSAIHNNSPKDRKAETCVKDLTNQIKSDMINTMLTEFSKNNFETK